MSKTGTGKASPARSSSQAQPDPAVDAVTLPGLAREPATSTGLGPDRDIKAIGLDRMLCFAVYKAEQAFNRVYRAALEPLGLTYPQFLVMRLLWNEGSLSVGDISDRLGLDSGTVTPLLKRLALMGLVKKARRADDERRVDIFLTDEGRALEDRSDAVMRCVFEAIAMDEGEGSDVLETVNRLTANLGRSMGR